MALVISTQDIDTAENFTQEKKQQSLYNYVVLNMGFSSPKAVTDIVIESITEDNEKGQELSSSIFSQCLSRILEVKASVNGLAGLVKYMFNAAQVVFDNSKFIVEPDARKKLSLLVISNIFEHADLTSEEKNEFISMFLEDLG